jgi:hypothetical protein
MTENRIQKPPETVSEVEKIKISWGSTPSILLMKKNSSILSPPPKFYNCRVCPPPLDENPKYV